jgi:hypothetical protein
MMAQIHWLDQVSADFSVAADWSGGVVPGAADDALLDAAGSTGYMVTASTSHTVQSLQTAAMGTLSVTGGKFTASSGTGTGSNAGEITVADAATLEVEGIVDNTGSIALIGSSAANLVVGPANATLTGLGTVQLGGGTAKRIFGTSVTATLINVSDTLAGAGYIGLAEMTLVNEAAGVIDASSIGQLNLNTKGEVLTNAGVLEASLAGATLVLNATTIDQSGGGTILASAGHVDLQNADVIGGKLATTGAGLIKVNSGAAVIDASVHAVSLTGELQVLGATTLTAQGAVTNSGKVNLYSGKLVVGAAGLTLTGGGQVNLNDKTANTIVGAASAATLTNVDNRIAGAGDVGDGQMTLINEASGIINGTASHELIVDTGTNTIQNAGLIANAGAGGTLIDSPIDNTGVLNAAGGTLTVEGAVTGGGVARVQSDSTLDFASTFTQDVRFNGTSGTIELADSVDYKGTLTVPNGGFYYLDVRDIAYGGGTMAFGGGEDGYGGIQVSDGTNTANFAVILPDHSDKLHLGGFVSDGHGGTLLEFTVDQSSSSTLSAVVSRAGGAAARLASALAGFATHGVGAAATVSREMRLATPVLVKLP